MTDYVSENYNNYFYEQVLNYKENKFNEKELLESLELRKDVLSQNLIYLCLLMYKDNNLKGEFYNYLYNSEVDLDDIIDTYTFYRKDLFPIKKLYNLIEGLGKLEDLDYSANDVNYIDIFPKLSLLYLANKEYFSLDEVDQYDINDTIFALFRLANFYNLVSEKDKEGLNAYLSYVYSQEVDDFNNDLLFNLIGIYEKELISSYKGEDKELFDEMINFYESHIKGKVVLTNYGKSYEF